ncbi:MAG: alpha/beta fold hydrolase [Acidobacteriota bacterium]
MIGPEAPSAAAPTSARTVLRIPTADGWRIGLTRLPAVRRRHHAVILCHGLAANHAVFELGGNASLASRLSAAGWDVWMLDLRGHGESDMPRLFGERRYGWCFDDYLRKDLPAAIGHVRAETGASVHWIGHSMGGILLYGHLALGGSDGVRSGVTIGSSLDYSASASQFHQLRRLRFLTRLVPAIPFRLLCRTLAPLAGRTSNPIERFLYWPGNMEGRLVRKLLGDGFHAISAPVLAQMASAFEPGGLRSADGTMRYIDGLAAATTPVLALAGDRDRQCPPDAAARTLDALGASEKRLAPFGPPHGHALSYGHFDLLNGRMAGEDVHPHVESWLEAHDRSASEGVSD